jgi:hypothetical protein
MRTKNTAIVVIGLTERKVKAISPILAASPDGKKIMFPVFTYRGGKVSLRKRAHQIVDKVFDEFSSL